MKSEKEKLAAKSVNALKAAAKRLGGKLVNPDGKAKTKQQLINTIVMKQRLGGKSMGGNAQAMPTKSQITKLKAEINAAIRQNKAEMKKLDALIKKLEQGIAKSKSLKL
jgi:hypothetical protein